MPTRDVTLTDHQDRFVQASVASGLYEDASEVVRAGLRLLEQRAAEEQAKLEWLRRVAEEGFGALDRGERVEVADQDLDAYLAGLGRHAPGVPDSERDAA